MGRRHHVEIALATLLVGVSPAVGQPPDADSDVEAVTDALEEPADPDDEMDIRADDDPRDVGQEALEPEGNGAPGGDAPSPSTE